MAHIHGNLLGLLMFVAGGIVAGVGALLLKLPDAAVMIAVGLTLVAADLIIRFRSRPQPGWVMGKQFGGYLFFIPVWGFGIVVVIANLANTLQQ